MSQQFFTYKEAKTYLKKVPVATNRQFRKWKKGRLKVKGLPRFNKKIPRCPDIVYKNAGWINWQDFLTKSQKKHLIKKSKLYKDFLTYEQAKRYLKKVPIVSNAEYTEWVKGKLKRKGLPKFNDKLPKQAKRYYKDKGWRSWYNFLSIQDKVQNKEHMPFKRAYLWMRRENKKNRIKNKKDFESYAKASVPFQKWQIISKGRFKGIKAISIKIPTNPEIHYQEKWRSWDHFLLNKKDFYSLRYMDYESAKKFVKKIGIESFRHWKRYLIASEKATKQKLLKAKAGKFKGELVFRTGEFQDLPPKPKTIPNTLERVYRAKWKGWKKFLDKKPENVDKLKQEIRALKKKLSRAKNR